jgi:hypothetical protein
MRSEHHVRSELRRWAASRAVGLAAGGLTDATRIFEGRHLTSLHVPELILLIEGLRQAPLDVEALRPDDFRDIDTIVGRFFTGSLR